MYLRNILIKSLISVIFILIVSYASYRLYPLVSGPKIEILSPQKGEKVGGGLIKIKGVALRAKEVKIFDRVISIDALGNFEEYIVSEDVFTDIIVSAKDKYGRMVTQKIFVQ